MGKLIKNMKPYWKSIILLIVLLFVEVLCDLSLPNYTSSIIDVGIQNSGIEFATPIAIRSEEYEKIKIFMTDDEKNLWTNSYSLGDDGNYYIKDDSKENLKILDESFKTPIVIYYASSQMKDENAKKMPSNMQMAMPNAQEIREQFSNQLNAMGDSMLHSTAVAYTKSEYNALGLNTNKMQTDYLWKSGGIMIGATFIMIVAAIFVSLLAAKVGASIGMNLRENVFSTVVKFSNTEMDKFSTASLITRSTNDIQQVQMASTLILRMMLYAPILAIGGIIMVLQTNANMEWIIALALVVIACIVGLLMAIAMPKFKRMQTLVDKVNLVSREILTGLSVIRAFGREDHEEKRFDNANTELTKNMLFTNRVMTFMMPIMMLLMNGLSILIIWVASHRIDEGVLEVGAMTAFITYSMMIVMSFIMLTVFSIMLPRATVAASRIDEVVKTQPSICDKEETFTPDDFKGVVEFSNVYFKYPNAEDYVLKDINFKAKTGETTAIIGGTGSGKSTLINLIPRLYDVTQGSVLIDGFDVRDVKQKTLREQIGFVPQKGVLFSGTIESNLRFGAKNSSLDDIKHSAQIAQASNFIEEKSDKYDSAIAQGGSNVSGGQKQRLSIARAVAKKPKIYIFDDSFSALDFKTDVALRKALEPNIKNSTVIIVAQRIST
ncbi:MAG: ABC transporter ATP-binding protein, partial [Clostridiales bacterium]|nr:ABC transporter ATP-binding protein [Clostridiales bacterium]